MCGERIRTASGRRPARQVANDGNMQTKEESMNFTYGAKRLAWAISMGFALLFALHPASAGAQVTTTTVQGTVYRADGSAATGTLIVSWPSFATVTNQAVAAGSVTATIGQDGFVSLKLAPNQGAYPAGTYYTAVYHLSDGTVNKEYWVVPAAATAAIASIRATLAPATVAIQDVSKSYVDSSIAAITGNYLPLTGGTMSGTLVLSGDPVASSQATTKHYTDALAATELPLAGGSLSGTLDTPNAVNKLPRVDVRHPDFGIGCPNAADPTGQQDSTCAIEAAVAWSVANPQGATFADIYFPAGTYKISSAIYLPCQVHTTGDGPQATIIEQTNNSQNAFTIYSGRTVQPNVWTCNGSLENMTIHAPGAHLYTATLIEIQPGAIGYTLFRIRGSGGGGRGLTVMAERFKAVDTEWDAIRWPIVTFANELKFLDTQIASAGQAADGYCFGNNCANGVFPVSTWSQPQVLSSASANGSVATFVVSGGSDSNSSNGVSPLQPGHWFTIAGIPDVTALNGVWQIASLRNNYPAANQYTVTANIAASGSANVTNATYKPTIVPDDVAAFYVRGAAISILGGSIKANWNAGCFQATSVFSGLVEGFYCEGFPLGGQPHVDADIIVNGLPFQTTTTGALTGGTCSNAAPCSAPVTSTAWAPWYINNPADVLTAGAALSIGLYPQDYLAGSTACSAYVTTPGGGCVQRGQFESVLAAFAGDGKMYITTRNVSGSTAGSGNIVWPAGTVAAEIPQSSYGTFTVKSTHLDSIDAPGTGWAVACNDTTSQICASAIVGSIGNGYSTTEASGGTVAVSFENDEWWGTGGAANELLGEGFIKVPGVAKVTATNGGLAAPSGDTAEVLSGQYINNHFPTVVAVQYADGKSGIVSYSNPEQGVFAANTGGPYYDSVVDSVSDPVLGANPGGRYAMGHQFAGSSCNYDTPPSGQPHALYRYCMKGGPNNTGSSAGWEYDLWNGSAWVNGLSIQGQSNLTANLNVTGTASVQGNLAAASLNGEITVDGVTYTNLNAAWSAAVALANSTKTNQTIRLGPGTFNVTATMTEPANGTCVNLIGSAGTTVNAGSAAATTLNVTTNLGGDVFFLGNGAQAQGCTFKDFVILAATNATHGFEMQWFRGLLIDNVAVNDTTAEGVLLGEGTTSSGHQANFLLRNLTVSYNAALFTPANRPAYGVHLQPTAIDSHLDDIVVRNALTAGVYNAGTGNTGYLVHGFGYPYTCATAPCVNNASSASAANASYATDYVIEDVGGGGSVWTDTYADSPAVAGFYIGANGVSIHGGHIQWPDLTSFPSANLAYVSSAVTNNMLIADISCLGMNSGVNWITYSGASGNPPAYSSVHHLTGCGNYVQALEPSEVTGFSNGGANINDPSGAVPRVWSTPIAAASSYPAYVAQLYTGYQGDIFQGHFSGSSPFFNVTYQGTIKSNGGIALSTVLNTASTLTLTNANKNVIANASSGPQTLTLPSCFTAFADRASPTGLEFTIIKSDTSSNAVTLQTVNSQTINYAGNASSSLAISAAGKRTLVCGPDFNWYAF